MRERGPARVLYRRGRAPSECEQGGTKGVKFRGSLGSGRAKEEFELKELKFEIDEIAQS